MIFRGLFIAAGVSLINTFDWIIYVFGSLADRHGGAPGDRHRGGPSRGEPDPQLREEEVLETRDFFAINDVAQSISDWGLVTRPTRISRWGMTKPRRPKLASPVDPAAGRDVGVPRLVEADGNTRFRIDAHALLIRRAGFESLAAHPPFVQVRGHITVRLQRLNGAQDV
jgi:hypothetical protein